MDIPSWCRVGQKVVCVDDKTPFGRKHNLIAEGAEYEIERVKAPYIVLTGVALSFPASSRGWNYKRFKPLTSQPSKAEQDAKLFNSWLTDLPTPEQLAMEQAHEEKELARALAFDAARGKAGA